MPLSNDLLFDTQTVVDKQIVDIGDNSHSCKQSLQLIRTAKVVFFFSINLVTFFIEFKCSCFKQLHDLNEFSEVIHTPNDVLANVSNFQQQDLKLW